jgi:hypothetical protein
MAKPEIRRDYRHFFDSDGLKLVEMAGFPSIQVGNTA